MKSNVHPKNFPLFFCLVAFLVMVSYLGAQNQGSTNRDDYEGEMAKATAAYAEGNLDEARATLQGLIRVADKYPPSDPKGAMVRSFLAVVEGKRGRHDNANKYHVDAVNLARIAQPEGGPELTLCLLRQGEYYHSQGKRELAEKALTEVLRNQETLPVNFSARARWALAEALYFDNKWAEAGQYAYFARQDVIRMFGENTLEQTKMLRLMIEASLKLNRGSYAKLMLDEYRQILIDQEDGPLLDPDYTRLKADFDAYAAADAERNLLAARRRAGALQNLTTNPLTAGQVGYAITRPESELIDKKFTLETVKGPGGVIDIKYGTHEVNDAALSMLAENGFLYKAVIGIALNSPKMTKEALHPALVDFTTLLFDPNEKLAMEWLLKTVNSADSALLFSNRYTIDGKSIQVSRDRDNLMLIVEFFPN
ncbi:MAG: hypothetical protein ACFCU1_12535 [Sumerlaeia bacterium]